MAQVNGWLIVSLFGRSSRDYSSNFIEYMTYCGGSWKMDSLVFMTEESNFTKAKIIRIMDNPILSLFERSSRDHGSILIEYITYCGDSSKKNSLTFITGLALLKPNHKNSR